MTRRRSPDQIGDPVSGRQPYDVAQSITGSLRRSVATPAHVAIRSNQYTTSVCELIAAYQFPVRVGKFGAQTQHRDRYASLAQFRRCRSPRLSIRAGDQGEAAVKEVHGGHAPDPP